APSSGAKRTERSPRSSVRSHTAHCRSVDTFVTLTGLDYTLWFHTCVLYISAHERQTQGTPPFPRPLARARARRAVHGAGAPAPPARAADARLRPPRAPAGADRRGPCRDGQPLSPPARSGGGGPRLLRVGGRQADVCDHRARGPAPRSVGRGASPVAGADATIPRAVRRREVTCTITSTTGTAGAARGCSSAAASRTGRSCSSGWRAISAISSSSSRTSRT